MPPKTAPRMNPALSMTLRAHRATAPGAPDKPRSKRTSAEVASEKTEKERLKSEKASTRTKRLKAVSEIEDGMDQIDHEREEVANHPPTAGKKKAIRPVAKGPTALPQDGLSGFRDEQAAPATENHLEDMDSSPPLADEESHAERSETLVIRQDQTKLTSQKVRGNEMEVSDESEGSEDQRIKSAKKKQMKKNEVRRLVEAGRAVHVHELASTHADVSLKRKVSDGIDTYTVVDPDRPTNKKTKPSQGGLRPEFRRALSKSHAGMVAKINSLNTASANDSANESGDALGGYSSDEDTTKERRALGSGHAQPVHYYGGGSTKKDTKIRSLVKIVPTTNVPELVSGPRRRAPVRAKKEDITTDNLPSAYREGFRLQVIPLVRQYTSTLGPWEAPPEADIITLFAAVFNLEVETMEPTLVATVIKLAEDRLSEWRNKFATAAMTALERLFDTLHLDTQERRAEYVQQLLGTDDKTRPFYYKEYESGELPVGIFQSALVSATLGNHYILTASIQNLEQTSETRPVGALVLAVQAVKRSLIYWTDGIKKVPSGPTGYFSKSNWGDHVERREGRNITVKSTSSIVRIASKLTTRQWEKIIAAAEEHATLKKEIATIDLSMDSDDSSSDFEILDGDEDLLGTSEDEDAGETKGFSGEVRDLGMMREGDHGKDRDESRELHRAGCSMPGQATSNTRSSTDAVHCEANANRDDDLYV